MPKENLSYEKFKKNVFSYLSHDEKHKLKLNIFKISSDFRLSNINIVIDFIILYYL